MMKPKMYRFYICCILLLSQSISFAQTTNGYANDFNIFRSALESLHPSLHQYIPKDEWDILIANAYLKSKSINNNLDFIRLIFPIAKRIGDAHINIQLAQENESGLFILPLRYIENKLITAADYEDIPRSAEIRSINGVSIETILDRLSKYIMTDANIHKNVNSKIALDFNKYFYYEFGPQKSYAIEYIYPGYDDIDKATIPSSDYVDAPIFDYTNKTYEPKLDLNKDEGIATLTIPTFHIDPQYFNYIIESYFQKLDYNDYPNLVIDVRDNPGGFLDNCLLLYSRLSYKIPVLWDSSYVNYTQNPFLQHSISGKENYFAFQKDRDYIQIIGDKKIMKIDKIETVKSKYRIGGIYKGVTYVLFNENSFSAASEFAKLTTLDPYIETFGTESGSNNKLQTAGFFLTYQLPHSKISFWFGLISLVSSKQNNMDSSKGVVPQHIVENSLDGFYEEQDEQLNAVKRVIENKR